MNIAEATDTLSRSHTEAGFALVREQRDGIVFRAAGTEFLLTTNLIEAFAQQRSAEEANELITLGAGYCTAELREHVIESISSGRQRILTDQRPIVFQATSPDGPAAEISQASPTFAALYMTNPSYLASARESAEYYDMFPEDDRHRPQDEASLPSLSLLYRRPTTVRISRMNAGSIDAAMRFSASVIASCLFQVGLSHHRPLRLAEKWPVTAQQRAAARFAFSRKLGEREFPFPRARYDDNLLKYYNLGLASDVPELQFLAFYQVLEFFFLDVADEKLYAQLARRVNDPRFRASPEWFDKLIIDVAEHRRTTDETEMLKLVLQRFVPHSDLIEFIEEYHRHVGRDLYWQKRERFGVAMSVNREANHSVGDVARLVKLVRNALVHSSDRHERAIRHVPFSATSEVIRLEVPLVRFLAERAIIGAAEPVS
jgi:hypothetical protein